MAHNHAYDPLVSSLCVLFIRVRRRTFRHTTYTASTDVSIVVHTLVLFYSLVSLNVAINSYDNALLTLLLSNQFVEIKSAVFKKFEKENLFQMSCAGAQSHITLNRCLKLIVPCLLLDIVERFQLTLMLSIIALRNLIELSGSTFSLLPTSFIPVMPSMSILQRIFSPALIVICSEIIVDWLKHAFITKFNHSEQSLIRHSPLS
jgi:hypothetical protein